MSIDRILAVGLLGALAACVAPAAGPRTGHADEPNPAPAKVPADFKLVIADFEAGPEPNATLDFLSHQGRIYLASSEDRGELAVYDPTLGRVELLDLHRRVQTQLPLKVLDEWVAKLRESIGTAADRRERSGGRGNEIAAAMSRNLIEPQFKATFDGPARRLTLTNASVTATAVGEPEADAARLAQIGRGLLVFTKLDSLRDPGGIPPFTRLEALHALIDDHRLRPAELTFLYRLAGPPRKRRWTYRLVPSLTAREVEAISRISDFRARARSVRFDRYEFPDEETTPKAR